MIQKLPNDLNMQDLFLDFRLEAQGVLDLNQTKLRDLTGKKTFSVGFLRDGIGFGITSVNIETKTSLQPIVDITFKDMYGNSVLNHGNRGSDTDYSLLFDWPPPKFKMTFKGYLGRPVTWLMNLKRIDTNYNSQDGSFEFKVSFVPNQWGFMADIPFLYLLAIKGLKKDIYALDKTISDKAVTIFDLIKIGKVVDFKQKEATKEFETLRKQLTLLKTNPVLGLINKDFAPGDVINGQVSGRAPIKGLNVPGQDKIVDFQSITIDIPLSLKDSDPTKFQEKLKLAQSTATNLSNENRKIWALIGNPNSITKSSLTIGADLSNVSTDFGSVQNDINLGIKKIDDNLKLIDIEAKRRLFETTSTQLGAITISEIFSRLSGDGGFILGSILDAGYRGFEIRNQAGIDTGTNSKLIGNYFPLEIDPDTKEQTPAFKNGLIDKSGAEMDFVRKFISALSEGIASNRLDENDASQLALQNQNKLIQRINNLELLSDNPYYGANSKRIIENLLVRSGIAAFITRGSDPNQPGAYNSTLGADSDESGTMRDLAKNEFKNLSDSVLGNLDDNDLLQLKRFCTAINNFFDDDGEKILSAFNLDGTLRGKDEDLLHLTFAEAVQVTTIVNPAGTNLLDFPILLNRQVDLSTARQDLTSLKYELRTFVGENSIFFDSKSTDKPTPYFSNSIDINTFRANYLYHNNILWVLPQTATDDVFIGFDNTNDIINAEKVNNTASDSDFNNNDSKENETKLNTAGPLGFTKVTNGDPEEKNNQSEYKRVNYLNKKIIPFSTLDYAKLTNVNSIPFIQEADGTYSVNFDSPEIEKPYFTKIINKNSVGAGLGFIVYSNKPKFGTNSNDDKRVFGLFDTGTIDDRGRNQRIFLKTLCSEILSKVQELENEKSNLLSQILGNATSNGNAIYMQMHHIFHQWGILAFGDDSAGKSRQPNLALFLEQEFGRTVKFNENGDMVETKKVDGSTSSGSKVTVGFKYDYPMEVINGNVQTDVENSIINIEPLYKPNANTTILNVIQQICTKNNFMFIPIPGNGEYENLTDIFNPSTTHDSKIGNVFNVFFTPTPESRSGFDNESDIRDQKAKENIRDSKLNAFEISFGSVDNTIVKSVQVSTDDTKPTAESILNLQRLVDKENTNKVTTTDCSTLSVIEGRSYKSTVQLLGNAQLSPMQYFYIESMPIFNGVYQVMNVKHHITPNDMETTIEGIKMRFDGTDTKGIKPITLGSLQALGNASSIAMPAVGVTGSTSTPITSDSIFGHNNELTQTFIDSIKGIKFSNSTDLNNFMLKKTGKDFVDWFNVNIGGKGPFNQNKSGQIVSYKIINKTNFNTFWDNAIPLIWADTNLDKKINFIEFLGINTIIINETGGSFLAKIPESVNSVSNKSAPGLTYAFGTNGGKKKSYNTLGIDASHPVGLNKTAFELFRDFHYKEAHGNLPYGDIQSGLRDTTNNLWAGQEFPFSIVQPNILSKIVDPKIPTFLSEADFFKFRGRGYIQITGRGNYKGIIEFILNYTGSNALILQYKQKWSTTPYNRNLEIIATRSTNSEWDDLFANTNLIIAILSIKIHAKSKYYSIPNLDLPPDRILIALLRIPDAISGHSAEYRELYKNRILVQTDALDVKKN